MQDDDISHSGVKGMKWGVRKEEELVGRNSVTPPKLTPREKAVLKAVGATPATGPRLEAMYGPDSMKPPKN